MKKFIFKILAEKPVDPAVTSISDEGELEAADIAEAAGKSLEAMKAKNPSNSHFKKCTIELEEQE